MIKTINLQLPNFLHKQVSEIAEKESIPMSQLITIALAEKLSALMTQDYLAERANRGSREKFEKAMAKVSKNEPEDYDRI